MEIFDLALEVRKKHLDLTTECITWVGCINNSGYGVVKKGTYRGYTAHRAAISEYLKLTSKLPRGIQACHACGNKLCVNPRHIYLGSHKENDNDKDQHGTRTRGVDRWNNVLTENQVLEICELLDQGFKHQDIAVQYGVSREAIGRINTGGTWGWLTRRTESNIRRKVFLAISPIGEVVEVHDMSKFIKEYGFCRSSVCRVLNGTYTQHKGWVFRYKR